MIDLLTDPNVFAAFIGGLTGGLLATLVAIYAVNKENRLVKNRAEAVKQDDKISYLKSIRTELNTIKERYLFLIGNEINERNYDDPPTRGFAKPNFNFFACYDSNLIQLGSINHNLANKISETYLNLKSFFDLLRAPLKIPFLRRVHP